MAHGWEEPETCEFCGEDYPKSQLKHEKIIGWLCPKCAQTLARHGEKLIFDNKKN